MTETIASVLILIGAAFVLVGSVGLLRFPDFFTRLHGPTKATTLGLAALLAGYIVYAAGSAQGISLSEILITFFLFITAPVSAHMLARSALQRRLRSIAPAPQPLESNDEGQH